MDIPSQFIAAFPPSADLLLDRVRRHLDDALLMDIARADYGYLAEEILAELRPIRDNGVLPDAIPWQLTEVLHLIRWCNPDNPNPPPFEPGPTGKRGHYTRLFACAVLLRVSDKPGYEDFDHCADSTLAQCLASAMVLGEEMVEAVARFLTWRVSRSQIDIEPTLVALGLLTVATRLRHGRLAERELGLIADWVLAEEALDRNACPWNPADPRPIALSIQRGFWQPLAERLKSDAGAIQAQGVRTNLLMCALLLETG